MARAKKLSKASKKRILIAQQKRLQRDLDRVSAKLEACLSCDRVALRKELGSIESHAERERRRLAKRLGLSPEEIAEVVSPSAKKASAKKVSSKKAAPAPAPAPKKKASSKKASKKKASKKASKKKASKKRSKKAAAS